MVQINELDLRDMMTQYCHDNCFECRFSGVCTMIGKWTVEDNQGLYNDLMEIALKPQSEYEYKLLKAIHNRSIECATEKNETTQKDILLEIAGMRKAYEVITGIIIDSDPDGSITEWFSGFPFYPIPTFYN